MSVASVRVETGDGEQMNTLEIELLSGWDEQMTTEALVGFVRDMRRTPNYDEMVTRLRALTLTRV